ncbi:hypothetical protein AiwAL_00490 [Acidiphilium sp. AL]|uniref:Uncharacterized protein n=1 Tax=Acidiphilium iwatense TaxID=768198 RepID=A0ABS9DYK1_9PROT|nr:MULTISPECIES: hypothetical protein [Acidiphilium]MCF3946409.1 hypothetical protein [Acidiphilium iwatense]MCU4158585.1 hypothetical protein [Acidiphilium sp. AL]
MSGDALGGLDLHAAFMRRASADQPAFIEALAIRLEQALPGRVHVERKKDGLFSKTAHIRAIGVDTGDAQYILEQDHGVLRALRARGTHGVVLKREILTVAQWLDGLNEALARLSDEADGAHRVLHDFLMS